MKFSAVLSQVADDDRNEVIDIQTSCYGALEFLRFSEELVQRKMNQEWAYQLFGELEIKIAEAGKWVLATGSVIHYINHRFVRSFR